MWKHIALALVSRCGIVPNVNTPLLTEVPDGTIRISRVAAYASVRRAWVAWVLPMKSFLNRHAGGIIAMGLNALHGIDTDCYRYYEDGGLVHDVIDG